VAPVTFGGNPFLGSTTEFDTTGGYDALLGTFVAPVAGNYHFEAFLPWSFTTASATATVTFSASININNVPDKTSTFQFSSLMSTAQGTNVVIDDVTLAAGDTVTVTFSFSSVATGTLTLAPLSSPGTTTDGSLFSGFLFNLLP